MHSMGRALQSYLGYALEERLHINTHKYDDPLIPLKRIRGVTERTDVKGQVVIPVRQEEVKVAVKELLEAGAKAIVICLLQSHKNAESERIVRDIALKEIEKLGKNIPVFASVDYYPQRKESHRMNTTILEAYAAEPSRQTLSKVSNRFKEHGAKFDLRVMVTHGGTISWKAKELARTIVSGPIGGVIGSKLLGETLGYDNMHAAILVARALIWRLSLRAISTSLLTLIWHALFYPYRLWLWIPLVLVLGVLCALIRTANLLN